MGQYYKPVNIDKKEFVYSHKFDSGLKLMEHSWIGNNFVAVIENLIKQGGAWYKNHIVWAGDYAEKEPGTDKNIYHWENTEIIGLDERNKNLRYLKNLDTKEYINLTKVPVSDTWTNPDTGKKHQYRIHPLPLLTCEGNGQGGGDFRGEDKNNLVGKWARNRVVIQSHKPKKLH
jgi:hypothetical protein